MSFSIATQSGNFSYQASITPQRDNHISFGFSFLNTGDSSIEDRIIFSGESGKLYDSENNFIYSYNSGEQISLSGNKIGNYNNYFINNVLLNSHNYNGTGYVNNFTENGVNADLSLIGVEPVVEITGFFENDNLTGNLIVKNESEVGISFNIFSGKFEALSNFFGFSSGQNTGIIEGQSSREFLIDQITNNTTGASVLLPISFKSDFGTFTRSGLISFTREYQYSISLIGQDVLGSTGIFSYDLLFSELYGQNYINDPFGLHFTFGNVSGYSGYANFDTKTGRISGSVSAFEISNTIRGTGSLTGLIFNSGGGSVSSNIITESSDGLVQENSSFILLESASLQQSYLTLSGYSTGLGVNYVGVIPAPIYTGSTVFATGEMSYPFLVSASGIVTGSDISLLRNVSGGYNFTETGAIFFTGQHTLFPSFFTGVILSGNTTAGQPVVTEPNTVLCFSYDRQSIVADSDQTRDKDYSSVFSGFSTGSFIGEALFPSDQAGLDITTVISGSKVSGSYEPFIGTGTGVFDVTGIFPMDTIQGGSYIANGYIINLGDSIITGLATGLLPEDPNLTGLVNNGTGITGAGSDQITESAYSGIFSGFSTGVFTGAALVPEDQANLTTTNIISGLKISGSAGAFIGTGTGFFDVTGVTVIDMKSPLSDYNMEISGITGLATGILPEDPSLITAVFSGTGVTGTAFVESTGFLTGSGIITGEVSSIMTGFTGISFNYNYIAEDAGDFFSGYTASATNNVTGKNIILDDILMSGDYEYRFSAIRPGVFEKHFIVQGQNQVAGFIDFTGEFTYSGTGVYQHTQDITGVGYTGIGIFGAITAPTKDITFSGSPTGRKLTNTGRLIGNEINLNGDSFGIPVSSVYDRYNPFHISGHSGIALICDHTNDTAPVSDFSTNDSSRSSYIHHPVWLRYNRLDSSDKRAIRAGLSPRYFLSGDGIHRSRDSNAIAISVYTGNDLNNLIWKQTLTETSNNNTRFNEDFIDEDFTQPALFTEDFYFLINRSAQSLEPSGFYYFYFQDKTNAQSAVSPSQFNTFFDSSSGSTRNYVTNYSSPTNVSGELLSADIIYPTGITSNRIVSYKGPTNFISGFNSFQTGFKMTGFAENVIVQGTGMTGIGSVNGTGEFSGILHALQDGNRFPNTSEENEIFTQMTGNFNGDKSVNNFEIDTGTFKTSNIFLLSKKVDNYSDQEVDEYESMNYKEVTRYRISIYQDSVEEISGDLKDRLERVGYSVYAGSGKLGFTSLPNMTYPIGAAFAFGTSTNSHLNSLSKDKKYATRQSGGLYTLIENGVETSTQGTNLPYSGIMSGGLGFSFASQNVTGTGLFNSGVTGNLFETGFTGIANTSSKLFISSLSAGSIVLQNNISTGSVPSTGLGTGLDLITVLAGEKSGSFPTGILNMFPFTGIGIQPLTQNPPEGGFEAAYAEDYIFSGIRTGIRFATGSDSTGFLKSIGYTGLQNTSAKYYIDALDYYDNIVDYEFNATGFIPTTGLGTGRDSITVTAGNTSGTFATTALDMLPFTGIGLAPITLSQPEGGFKDSYADGFVFSGLRTGYNFATGIVTGSFDYTGLINYSQYNSFKTGVKVGIGLISGDVTGIIYPGSGEFNFSGIKTGLPSFINSVVGQQGESILTSSGNVPITPFTGSLNRSYIGTGFYSENITPSNLHSLTYDFGIPNYRKTFTGEYEIITGINNTGLAECTGFLNVPSIDLTGYSGYVTLTGDDDLTIKIVKKKYFDDSQDINIIKYSGIGTLDLSYDSTGSLTFIG